VIMAVTLEKVKDKQVPKVAAVLVQSYFCGE
jgi:hypothetical protein